MRLIQGDCLTEMKNIPDKSIDLILTDPPYGTTACKWDTIIPLDKMWVQLKRIIKDNGAIVLFGSEPFSSYLRMSNIKDYKYDWIWEKTRACNFNSVNYQPLKMHEIISVFCKHNYYPIKKNKTGSSLERIKYPYKAEKKSDHFKSNEKGFRDIQKYPSAIIKINNEVGLHPTQKPVALMEYLIKTYTNENETVLDFTMGSGTTGVACKQLNRDFIGIELDEDYFKIAETRINKAVRQDELFTEQELR